MRAETYTYAIIDRDDLITNTAEHVDDADAQTWHLDRGSRGRLVALDLGSHETPRIGDKVAVDDDGWKAQRKTQRLGKIVCAECGGTDTNPKIRGCSGVIHDQ